MDLLSSIICWSVLVLLICLLIGVALCVLGCIFYGMGIIVLKLMCCWRNTLVDLRAIAERERTAMH